MAKKTGKPNIPQETLNRARQQVSNINDPAVNTDDERAQELAERAARRAERRARAAAGRDNLRASSTTNATSKPAKRDKPQHDQDNITQLLANPIKMVSEEELHAEYGYVLSDVRNMFVLAVGLMVTMIVLAQIL